MEKENEKKKKGEGYDPQNPPFQLEFVGFDYERRGAVLGVCHVYIIDYGLDMRGIKVYAHKQDGKLFFMFPGHVIEKEGKRIIKSEAYVEFTDNKKNHCIHLFLKEVVQPEIKKQLNELNVNPWLDRKEFRAKNNENRLSTNKRYTPQANSYSNDRRSSGFQNAGYNSRR